MQNRTKKKIKVKRTNTQPSPIKKSVFSKIGIYRETDQLRSAVLWGPVGAEAVLAQIYPPEISLFYDKMDVVKARKEALRFAKTLTSLGVKIIFSRDRLAATMPSKTQLTFKEVTEAIKKKAREEREKAHLTYSELEQQIDTLIKADIKRYGKAQALELNKLLCLDPQLALGNLIYARDQMNVLMNTRIISSMKKPIRQGEIEIYERVYKAVLPKNTPTIQMPNGETFEGGDAYIHNGVVYIGVGSRTSEGAAKHIFKELYPQLQKNDLQFAMVVDPDPENRPLNEQMDFMHLDTFSSPIGYKEIAVCEEEVKRRQVIFLELNKQGKVVKKNSKQNFLMYLQTKEERVVVIPREEQQEFGCNFLAYNAKTLLLPLGSNTTTIKRFKQAKKKIIILNLEELTRGYGAAHCMTGQLLRKG